MSRQQRSERRFWIGLLIVLAAIIVAYLGFRFWADIGLNSMFGGGG